MRLEGRLLRILTGVEGLGGGTRVSLVIRSGLHVRGPSVFEVDRVCQPWGRPKSLIPFQGGKVRLGEVLTGVEVLAGEVLVVVEVLTGASSSRGLSSLTRDLVTRWFAVGFAATFLVASASVRSSFKRSSNSSQEPKQSVLYSIRGGVLFENGLALRLLIVRYALQVTVKILTIVVALLPYGDSQLFASSLCGRRSYRPFFRPYS